MAVRRDYNLDGAMTALRKARVIVAERLADLKEALRVAQEDEMTNAEQVDEAKSLIQEG